MRKRDIINNVKTKKIDFSFLIGVELLYNVVLISAIQRSESAIHIHTFPSSRLFFLILLVHLGGRKISNLITLDRTLTSTPNFPLVGLLST